MSDEPLNNNVLKRNLICWLIGHTRNTPECKRCWLIFPPDLWDIKFPNVETKVEKE